MTGLNFVFFKLINEVEISLNTRVSVWLEGNDYLMPCEFTYVLKESNFHKIKVSVLDPKGFMSVQLIDKKFLFGHPGKIIGHGILKEIDSGK